MVLFCPNTNNWSCEWAYLSNVWSLASEAESDYAEKMVH